MFADFATFELMSDSPARREPGFNHDPAMTTNQRIASLLVCFLLLAVLNCTAQALGLRQEGPSQLLSEPAQATADSFVGVNDANRYGDAISCWTTINRPVSGALTSTLHVARLRRDIPLAVGLPISIPLPESALNFYSCKIADDGRSAWLVLRDSYRVGPSFRTQLRAFRVDLATGAQASAVIAEDVVDSSTMSSLAFVGDGAAVAYVEFMGDHQGTRIGARIVLASLDHELVVRERRTLDEVRFTSGDSIHAETVASNRSTSAFAVSWIHVAYGASGERLPLFRSLTFGSDGQQVGPMKQARIKTPEEPSLFAYTTIDSRNEVAAVIPYEVRSRCYERFQTGGSCAYRYDIEVLKFKESGSLKYRLSGIGAPMGNENLVPGLAVDEDRSLVLTYTHTVINADQSYRSVGIATQRIVDPGLAGPVCELDFGAEGAAALSSISPVDRGRFLVTASRFRDARLENFNTEIRAAYVSTTAMFNQCPETSPLSAARPVVSSVIDRLREIVGGQ